MNLLNTAQAAEALGVSERRVRALISDGRLPAQMVGRDHVIREEDLALVAERKPGRPPKAEESVERAATAPSEKATKRKAKKAGAKKAAKK